MHNFTYSLSLSILLTIQHLSFIEIFFPRFPYQKMTFFQLSRLIASERESVNLHHLLVDLMKAHPRHRIPPRVRRSRRGPRAHLFPFPPPVPPEPIASAWPWSRSSWTRRAQRRGAALGCHQESGLGWEIMGLTLTVNPFIMVNICWYWQIYVDSGLLHADNLLNDG